MWKEIQNFTQNSLEVFGKLRYVGRKVERIQQLGEVEEKMVEVGKRLPSAPTLVSNFNNLTNSEIIPKISNNLSKKQLQCRKLVKV